MKRYSKFILWTLTIIIVIALLVLALVPKAVPVITVSVTKGNLVETLTAEGTTRYHDTYLISAPIAGLITRTEFEVGARLRSGDVLADILPPVIDPRQLEELQARLDEAKALEAEAANHISQAKITLEQAKQDNERTVALVIENAATRMQLERDSDAYAQAQQDVLAAEARLRSSHNNVQAIKASMLNKSSGTQILLISPINGVLLEVHEKNAREVVASAPLFEIGDTSRQEVVIDLLSSDAPRVHISDSVLITVPGVNRTLHAKIRLIEPDAYIKISPLGIEEKRVNVIAALQDRVPELGSTYRVDATMVLWSGTNILKAPISALFRNGKNWSVWTVRDGKAHEQKINVGHMNDTEAEILNGLNLNDIVIVHPSNEVIENAKVKTTINIQ